MGLMGAKKERDHAVKISMSTPRTPGNENGELLFNQCHYRMQSTKYILSSLFPDNLKLLRSPNHRTNSTVRSLVRYWQRQGTIPIGIYVTRSKDRDQRPDARKSHSSPQLAHGASKTIYQYCTVGHYVLHRTFLRELKVACISSSCSIGYCVFWAYSHDL